MCAKSVIKNNSDLVIASLRTASMAIAWRKMRVQQFLAFMFPVINLGLHYHLVNCSEKKNINLFKTKKCIERQKYGIASLGQMHWSAPTVELAKNNFL
ncbi:MAG: hypothetical protein A2Y62_19620 [Candidatus Fischerbacteria bacterium RBG_13_37_8]|uniref:Uncharacterized protein n=1 Tax=Candidatus Fischerbacteria bacterium RBG_13_37_8 TaxID=1817863 RepID=A0A1F5VQM8_9BACT|nr:MAG: hypothetical protein A2Y62_19620 [Candidatus Fischerbacteria bacterium RBG_13_37_8]